MAIRALKAAEKTTNRGCFMAMSAAMRNVLSPISEKMIMANERTKEWRGCMMDAGAAVRAGKEGVNGFSIARGSLLDAESGTGCGMS